MQKTMRRRRRTLTTLKRTLGGLIISLMGDTGRVILLKPRDDRKSVHAAPQEREKFRALWGKGEQRQRE